MVGLPPFMWGPPLDVLPRLSPPVNVTPIGNPSNESIDLYLGSTPMNAIAQALQRDSTVIGLLIGHPGQHDQRPLIIVTDCIFSAVTDLRAETHFSDDALSAAHETWQNEFPDAQVVGWFYGSPDRSEITTSLDRSTHERLFAHPWQIGLLIDSAQNTSVVIRWDKHELVPSDQYYYWDMNDQPDPLTHGVAAMAINEVEISDQDGGWSHGEAWSYDQDHSEQWPEPQRAWALWPWVAVAAIVIALAYAGGSKWTGRTLAKHTDNLNYLKEELIRLENESALLTQLTVQTETDIRESIRAHVQASAQSVTPAPPSATDAAAATGGTAPNVATTATNATTAAVAAASVNLNGVPQDVTYVIQPGDTMWKISESLIGDPNAYRTLALSNAIGDPDLIYPGQRLVVPGPSESDR